MQPGGPSTPEAAAAAGGQGVFGQAPPWPGAQPQNGQEFVFVAEGLNQPQPQPQPPPPPPGHPPGEPAWFAELRAANQQTQARLAQMEAMLAQSEQNRIAAEEQIRAFQQ